MLSLHVYFTLLSVYLYSVDPSTGELGMGYTIKKVKKLIFIVTFRDITDQFYIVAG